jgi:hypothetical protein
MLLALFLACTSEDDAKRADPGRVDDPPRDSASADTAAPDTDSGAPQDTDDAPVPSVQILSPGDGALVSNPVTFTVQVDGVASATLDADGYALGDVDGGTSELSYTFSGTGYPRVITLSGRDGSGAVVATDAVTIEVEAEGVDLDVPYFYQYDNANEPGSTCGVTSAAMLLNHWDPGSVTPDGLYRAYGKAQGQSPSGLAQLYAWEGLYADHGTSGTRAELRAHLDAGRPVVVHGYWTSAGHIVVIVGYTDTDWIVNDPAGDWYTCYGCGPADHVEYPLGGAWDAELSVDGDIWWSTAADAPF